MAKEKGVGQQVREAIDGPKVDHDELISNIQARAAEQHSRSSDGSESAAKVSAFIEKTGLNSQAYSWGSSIIKKLPKKDGQAKAMDVIRSLKTLLPMLENHVAGQGSAEMDLGEPEKPAKATKATKADPVQEQAEDEPSVEDVIRDGDPELAEEAKAFDNMADGKVTPINFGGAKG